MSRESITTWLDQAREKLLIDARTRSSILESPIAEMPLEGFVKLIENGKLADRVRGISLVRLMHLRAAIHFVDVEIPRA